MMNAPKKILSLSIIFLLSLAGLKVAAQSTQYVTIFGSSAPGGKPGVLPLATNQVVSYLGYGGIGSVGIIGYAPNGASFAISSNGSTFTGLTNITVTQHATVYSTNDPIAATFQITVPAGANSVSNNVPGGTAVIPANATGNVQIILESSSDLANWTAANPGIYSATSATNRFFRVRAVAQ